MTLQPIRVLMVNDSLAMGGAERVAVDLANGLDRRSHHVQFCSTRHAGPLAERLADDVTLHVLGRTATWDLAPLVAFARLVRRERIDIVHTHGRGTMKFVALARSLGLIHARHVFHDHFGWLHLYRGAGPDLRAPLQHAVDAYLGVDSRLCTWARDTAGVAPERIHLMRSGVDLERFEAARPVDLRTRLGLRDDQVLVAMIANFRPQKDHPTLFRAIAELPAEDRRRLVVAVIGSTSADPEYHASCVAMVERLGIEDNVVVLGSSDDPPGMLAGADAALLSSKNETGPLVVLEYMASGLPFVATETGEIAHAVKDLGVGFVPAPRDHLELSQALADLLALTPGERQEMGRRGRRIAAEVFDQRLVTRSVERVYEVVLGLRSGPVPASAPAASTPAGGRP